MTMGGSIPGQVGLDSIRKIIEQARDSNQKQHFFTVSALVHASVSLGDKLSAKQNVSETNPFPTLVDWSQCLLNQQKANQDKKPSMTINRYNDKGDNHDREKEECITVLHVNMIYTLLSYIDKLYSMNV